jgi:hypothetical protein
VSTARNSAVASGASSSSRRVVGWSTVADMGAGLYA